MGTVVPITAARGYKKRQLIKQRLFRRVQLRDSLSTRFLFLLFGAVCPSKGDEGIVIGIEQGLGDALIYKVLFKKNTGTTALFYDEKSLEFL